MLSAVAIASGPTFASARPAPPPTLAPVIVQAGSAAAARAAVQSVIALAGGTGTIPYDLPLVNGVLANLTTPEISRLTSYVVTPDAAVLPAGKVVPAAAPRQLDNVFPQVTGATRIVAGGNSGQGVGVAVLDTGVAPLADFAGRLRTGVDLSGEGNAQLDSYGHGTFVAGLVAGNGASSNGTYVGEAPAATVVPVKVAGKSGSTTLSTVIRGLQWVKDNTTDGIRVVNMSLGAIPTTSTALNPLDQAVEVMWRSGFVVVTSAGNNGPNKGTITSPGDDPLVITVGALDDKDTVATADDAVPSFSSQGPTPWDGWWKPDLLAPGKSVVSVTSTTSVVWNANKTARVGTKSFVGSGTSFAAAITSGAAAMLLHENPLATPDNVKAALLTTTNAGPSPPQSPFVQGHGVLDVGRAVDEPLISLAQSVSAIVPPAALGLPVSLVTRQAVSTWATVSAADQPFYAGLYPFPYSGPATTATDGGSPLFQSSAWNSSAWNSSAWNSSAWNSSAWNSSAWNSSAWNSSAWNSSAWN
ncbi:MAG: peptidase and in kexin sedolisin [Frankiales bacterium]|nr:peptidase and in kexin sedolisin [Frankiales bacterium]